MPDIPVPLDWFQRRTDEELRDLRHLITDVTPRREIELRFESMKTQLDSMDTRMERVEQKIDDLAGKVGRNSLPAWLVSAITSIILILIGQFAVHYVK